MLYFSEFYERLKRKHLHFNVCLVGKTPSKVKDLICWKIYPIKLDQLSSVFIYLEYINCLSERELYYLCILLCHSIY